jgi:hypothetical protein
VQTDAAEDGSRRRDGQTRPRSRAGRQLRDDCDSCSAGNDDSYVYFVEFRRRGTFLRASPIDGVGDRA